jgi:hypothetical protein
MAIVHRDVYYDLNLMLNHDSGVCNHLDSSGFDSLFPDDYDPTESGCVR